MKVSSKAAIAIIYLLANSFVTLAHGSSVCNTANSAGNQRIISIGGANTEILYALGLGECITAVDTSSTYPDSALKKPKVGYMRALSAEPILAMRPTLIVIDEEAGPAEAIKHLQAFGVPLLQLPSSRNFESLSTAIDTIGETTATHDRANAIQQRVEAESAALNRYLALHQNNVVENKPRVAFLMNFEAKDALLAGVNTAAHSMIELAGGNNAVTSFEGYKTVSGETLTKLNPDIIVTTYRAIESLGVDTDAPPSSISATLAELPAIKFTEAARNKEIHLFDTHYLLGFGPRSAQAALALAKIIHASH